MSHTSPLPRTLNPTQLMLLKLFNREMSEDETTEIQALIFNYLDEKLQAQVEKDVIKKGITQADLDAVLNQSQRTCI